MLENIAGPASSPATASARHGKSFRNPWPSAKRYVWREISTSPFEKKRPIPHSITDVKTVKPTIMKSPKRNVFTATSRTHKRESRKPPAPSERINATWFGHASVLAQFRSALDPSPTNDISVLFDPVFSQRASPFTWAGPKRRLALPCSVAALPVIHAVCISHNHYDHLDKDTIAKLVKHDTTGSTIFFVPLGCGTTLIKAGVLPHRIIEKDWWEDETLCFGAGRSLRITCTPAQHNSSRKLFDWDKSLWSSWVVEHEQDEIAAAYSTPPPHTVSDDKTSNKDFQVQHMAVSNVFFAGDTGYRSNSFGPVCPAFEEIGSRFGPLDLAFIPIWRGGLLSGLSRIGLRLKPEAFVRHSHCTPIDALDLHKDIQASTSVAIHHSTFVGEDEARWSIQLLKRACDSSFGRAIQFQRGGGDRKTKKSRKSGRFVVLNVGERIAV